MIGYQFDRRSCTACLRSERDSNPRYNFLYTRLAIELFRPLRHHSRFLQDSCKKQLVFACSARACAGSGRCAVCPVCLVCLFGFKKATISTSLQKKSSLCAAAVLITDQKWLHTTRVSPGRRPLNVSSTIGLTVSTNKLIILENFLQHNCN